MPEPGVGDMPVVPMDPEPISPMPSREGQKPRSKIYSELKIRNDYEMFTGQKAADKPIGEIQRDLFGLLAKGEVEDENQAFEWLLGRKWDEFDDRDRQVVKQFASDKGKEEYGDNWKLE